ncbi:MAG: nuclear transport factor 2 family protein [Planctomycetota bacterium]
MNKSAPRWSNELWRVAVILGLSLWTGQITGKLLAVSEEVLELSIGTGGAKLRYVVLKPSEIDNSPVTAGKLDELPILLALPPGAQDQSMVEAGLSRYWAHAAEHGWLVVSPIAPAGESWTHPSATATLSALLDHIETQFRPEGGRVHLAGVSNGGRSAFGLAIELPARFASLTALPGYPTTLRDASRVYRLRAIPVAMFAGELDIPWVEKMRATEQAILAAGGSASLELIPQEGHVPESLTAPRVLLALESHRQRVRAQAPDTIAIHRMLDDFHHAAAHADAKRYFDHFAPNGVFLGTDAAEHWTVDQFRNWSAPYFARPSAWTYVPASRSVTIDEAAACAWFDELLDHASYGECRGSGTLVRAEGRWRIGLYHLSIPVPNDLARAVADIIRDGRKLDATRVFVVRHAEKATGAGEDPPLTNVGVAQAADLTRLLASVPLRAIYTTPFTRTRSTAAAVAATHALTPIEMAAAKTVELVAQIRATHRGQDVLVVGHSNTVPAILRALGHAEPPVIDEQQYGQLFLSMSFQDRPPELIELRFGE